ncbi:MAG TPA: PP2C family protein-serine/threonine phosphatase [Bacteroidia bacterium]
METATQTQTQTRNFFILYKPKDIVSGDFYYALSHQHRGKDNEIFYLCTADCTGHGVPGALMSMLGISSLNESIIEKDISDPGKILDNVRTGLINSLNPEGMEEENQGGMSSETEMKDGMDCILCAFDFENNMLRYANANNSFYLIRDGQVSQSKVDKMPVGKSPKEDQPFTTHSLELKKGDVFYCLTDGYPDQFGGDKGKKFKYKQLEEKLLSICDKPMEEQKRILDDTFESWKGNLEQVDDVLIIGLRI